MDDIRRLAGVVNNSEKAKEGILRWLGSIMRREPQSGARRAYEISVKGNRSRGRQKQRWWDVVQRNMKNRRGYME